jgi:hypothetical protein
MLIIRQENMLSEVLSFVIFFVTAIVDGVFFAGLAETLRSELLLYSISVHIYFPGTIYTPGYITENKTKPSITLKIEEDDKGMEPGPAAVALFNGL